jgi:hypothetical protein
VHSLQLGQRAAREHDDVNRRIALARKRTSANTIPHLVSIAIATGDLVWHDEQRALNGFAHA